LAPFDYTASSTFATNNQVFDDTYGSGDVVGAISTDTVLFGGFTQTNQAFAAVIDGSGMITSPPASGLMGLAWSSLSETGTPLWENLAESGQETVAEFGVYLARYQNDTTATADELDGGEFTLG